MKAADRKLKILGDALCFRFEPDLEIAERQAAYLEGVLTGGTAVDHDLRDHARARALLAETMKQSLDAAGARRVRIGVSSGLDSRALLGALGDVLDMENVFAYTYGHPGNRDYEHAAALIGGFVRNHELHNYVEKSRFETVMLKGVGSDNADVDIRGYLGDALAGGHLRTREAPDDWISACWDFIGWQVSYRNFRKRGWLPEGYDPSRSLPASPWISPRVMAYDDQLDLIIRQHQRIVKKPGAIDERNLALTGFASVDEANRGILAPFCHPRVMSCFLNTPRDARFGEQAYREFLRASYGAIFPDLAPEDPYVITRGATNVELTHIWPADEALRLSFRDRFEQVNKAGFDYSFDDFSEMIHGGDKIAAKFAQGLVKAAPLLRRLATRQSA